VIHKEVEENKDIDNNNGDNLINNILENNNKTEEINPYFVPLNSWEIGKNIKEYKWEGIIKVIILFGDNGFIKQIIKNIDCYHNNYIIINLNKITKQEKSHFNNIINNIYSFEDLISYLKQDIYECSNGKNNIKEISDKYEQYLDLLKRYTNYDLNANNKLDNKEPNYFFINFGNKNNIIINKKEWALFDANSSSKSYICQCFSSKIKKDWENGISNLLNPEHIINQINVELAISNNIYNIMNINANDDNINFHINDLTLGKKMIGSIKNKMDKNYYNQDFFLNNILLNYAICDYICDIFNMKLSKNGINLNVPEICFYQCPNYVVPYFIAKEYHESYKKQYNLELYESFSHFSYCVSLRKILIEDDIFDIPRSIVKGEDMLMNIRIAFKLKTCPIVLYENVYNYRKHDTSCVHTFVPTLEYEEEYHKLRKEAILGTSCTIKHLQASVESRLEAYMFHVDVSPEDSSWNHSEFVKEIQRDALSCRYSLPMIIRVLFKTDKSILRRLIVFVWRTYAYIMNLKNFL
jgi:hypothetical protein